jgi:hypothetical protein
MINLVSILETVLVYPYHRYDIEKRDSLFKEFRLDKYCFVDVNQHIIYQIVESFKVWHIIFLQFDVYAAKYLQSIIEKHLIRNGEITKTFLEDVHQKIVKVFTNEFLDRKP